MKQSITLKSAGPFLLLTFIYFIVGFLTTVNGQCQGPLKIAFLSEVTTTKNSLATLISFAFFLGYLLNKMGLAQLGDTLKSTADNWPWLVAALLLSLIPLLACMARWK